MGRRAIRSRHMPRVFPACPLPMPSTSTLDSIFAPIARRGGARIRLYGRGRLAAASYCAVFAGGELIGPVILRRVACRGELWPALTFDMLCSSGIRANRLKAKTSPFQRPSQADRGNVRLKVSAMLRVGHLWLSCSQAGYVLFFRFPFCCVTLCWLA